jgi:16S rRNA (cytidine1402-2'-O)-methyltransferase
VTKGTLYLVATPIGNLEDITLRALRILAEADIIACEDTRHTRKLLTHYNIAKSPGGLVSYHEHNERERAAELVAKLESGSEIALVSDAGMPLISDPGYHLVREASEHQIQIVPIPGASAVVTALAASGLPTVEFLFAGFLPSRNSARRARLADFISTPSTLVFYETPHRINETLRDAREVLGDRPAAVARELTKLHEEFIRGKLSEIAARVSESGPRGEYVLVIGPPVEGGQQGELEGAAPRSILDEVSECMKVEGLDQKAALKRVAKARGISKSEAYRMLMVAQGKTR